MVIYLGIECVFSQEVEEINMRMMENEFNIMCITEHEWFDPVLMLESYKWDILHTISRTTIALNNLSISE